MLATGIDIVVVTTGIGFRGWIDTAEAAGLDDELVEALAVRTLIARGPKARGALQAAGLVPDWVAESETSAEIAEFLLAEGVKGCRSRCSTTAPATTASRSDCRAPAVGRSAWSSTAGAHRRIPAAVERSVRDSAAGVVRRRGVHLRSGRRGMAGRSTSRVDDDLRRLEKDRRLVLAAVGPVTADPAHAGIDPFYPDRARMGALVRSLVMSLGDESDSVPTPSGLLHVRATAATLDHESCRSRRRPGDPALPGDRARVGG